MFVPTLPPDVQFAAAVTVPEKYREMMQAPARAEEELREHPDITESMLVEQKEDEGVLGLLQGATAARTGAARMLSNMGKVERMLSKELAGHPEIKAEELRDLRQAEDLVHSAGQLMPHKRTMKHVAFMQQKTNAKATTAASLVSQAHQELHNYGMHMKTLAQADKQTAKKLGEARDTVEEALETTDAQVSELLISANVDKAVVGGISQKLDQVIQYKNDIISELHEEVQKIKDSHKQMVRTYESKMAEYGIPPEELGFTPAIMD